MSRQKLAKAPRPIAWCCHGHGGRDHGFAIAKAFAREGAECFLIDMEQSMLERGLADLGLGILDLSNVRTGSAEKLWKFVSILSEGRYFGVKRRCGNGRRTSDLQRGTARRL